MGANVHYLLLRFVAYRAQGAKRANISVIQNFNKLGGGKNMRNKILVLAACAVLSVGCSSGHSNPPPASGTGGTTTPNINVSTTAINYGSVGVNSNASQTVTVSNSGTAALTLGTITAPAVPFMRTGGTCANGQILAVSANCTIILQYAPTAAVVSNSSFNVSSNDPDAGTANGQNNVQIALTGTGTAAPVANINVNPTTVSFGTVTVGSNASQTVTVSNSGNATLTLGTITSPAAPFSRTGGTCANSQPLAAAASCTIILQYAPTAAVVSNSSFNVPSNDPDAGTANGQNNVLVGLSGSGATSVAATNLYYTGVPSASSAVGGLFSVSSTSPSTPATVNLSALVSGASGWRNSTVWTGTLDSATGIISNSRVYAVVFAANGRLQKQYADQAPAPTQISNVTTISAGLGDGAAGSSATDLCYMNIIPDLAVPENSVVIYGQAGANATCGDLDDTYFWLRLSSNTSTAPTALTDLPVAPVWSGAGAITNFLVINSATGALEKRDANFGGTATTISAGPFSVTANDKNIWLTHLSSTRILLHLPPPCSSPPCSISGELRIVDAGANTITGALGTTANRAAWYYNFANDSSNVYFVGNDAAGTAAGIIQRFPVNGTSAATTFRNAGAVQIFVLYSTANSVVYPTDNGAGSFSFVSSPKAGGAPVTLANFVNESFALYGASSTGYVYFSRMPVTLSAHRAEAVKDDGTGHVIYGATNGAVWSGAHFATTSNSYTADYSWDQFVVAEYAVAAASMAGATLSVVDASTAAKNGIVVGTVPAGIQSIGGFGEGSRLLYQGFDGDTEIFYVDTAVAGSLTRVTTDSVGQQPLY
jgi:hypothetical protein